MLDIRQCTICGDVFETRSADGRGIVVESRFPCPPCARAIAQEYSTFDEEAKPEPAAHEENKELVFA